jgi:hypothetical protein
MKQGKRTRRALIRLRHNVSRQRFIRWATRITGPVDEHKVHKYCPRLWHQWHALGCP